MPIEATRKVSAAASGRLPTTDAERVYVTYGSFLRTVTAMAGAVWVFLLGSVLPAVGNTRLGLIGYACGLVIGNIPVLLSSALPSYRDGVDSIDASKAALGVRGALLPLVGLLITSLGWASVVMAMVARGVALLVVQTGIASPIADKRLVVGLCFVILFSCGLLLQRGVDVIRRLNDYVGPGLIALATVSLVMLISRFGAAHLLKTNVPLSEALTTDGRKQFMYAAEFGLMLSLSWWPFVGGLYRLVKYRKHTIGPFVIGGSLFGGAYSGAVAALAAVNLGSTDPVVWMIKLAGPSLGVPIVMLILIMSIPTICMLVYFAAVSVQQVKILAHAPWGGLIWIILAPLSLVAFNTEWAISHIIAVATYGALLFIGVTAIGLVDYYVLRRQTLAVEQLFVKGPDGHYWFWAGVNWIAFAIIAGGIAVYLSLYDPISLRASDSFRYFGAGLPVLVGSALLYYALMRAVAIPLGRGGYKSAHETSTGSELQVEVGL